MKINYMKKQILNELTLQEKIFLNGGSTVPTYDNPINYEAAVERGEAIVTFVAGFISGFLKELF